MAQTKDDLCLPGRVFLQRPFPNRLTELNPVTVTDDCAVRLVHERQMNRTLSRLCFLRSVKGIRSTKIVAARHPLHRVTFGEHDGVKHASGIHFDRNDTSAALCQIVQLDPRFQSFFRDFRGNSRCDHPGASINDQCAVLKTSILLHGPVQCAHTVFEIGVKFPASKCSWWSGRCDFRLPTCGDDFLTSPAINVGQLFRDFRELLFRCT